ncbi:MAG: universal stress protein [Acidimicrobiia bacterium]
MTDSPPLLVLADDGTAPSTTAWNWMSQQPWKGWRVAVMTADETAIEWGRPAEIIEWTPEWERPPEMIPDATVRFLHVNADPRVMLAEREDADLIVVGMRSESHLEAVVSGSTTEWLLHHPPAPLVVVTRSGRVRNVTVCVDGSDHALAALDSYLSLPLSDGTNLTLLSVEDGRVDAEAALKRAQLRLEGAAMAVNSTIGQGRPTPSILDHIATHTPDLVVMGTRGLTGWQRLRLGSTALAVVRSAKTTCLVTSAPAAD